MGRRKKQDTCCQQQKHVKSQSKIEQGIFGNKSSSEIKCMINKYKEILGFKEPVVVLKKLPESFISVSRVLSTNLRKNKRKNKEFKKEKSKCGTQKVECSKSTFDKSKKKKSRHRKIVPKEKNLYKDTKELESESWEIKHDTDLKIKASKDVKNLKVSLKKIKRYDQNSNIIGPSDKLKPVHKNNIHKEVQRIQLKKKYKKIGTTKVKIKQKRNVYKNLEINKNQRSYESSSIDLDNFSHSAVDFSQGIFSKNYILNRYMASIEIPNAVGNIMKETNESCMSIEREGLALERTKESIKTPVCETLDKNVGKVRKLPTIIKEDVLPKHSFQLVSKEAEISQPCKEGAKLHSSDVISNIINFQDSKFSQVVLKKSNITHVTECLETNNKQISNFKRKFVIPKIGEKDTRIDNDTIYQKAINVISNEAYNSEFNNELDKENNKNTLFASQSLLPENCTSYTSVNSVNNLNKEYLNLDESAAPLNTNTSLIYAPDHTSAVAKSITKNIANNASRYSSDNADLFKQKRLITDKDTNSQPQKKIKVDYNKWLKSFANVGKAKKNVVTSATTSSFAFELNDKGIVPQRTISSSLNNVKLNSGDIIADIDQTKSQTDKGIPDFRKQNQIESVKDIQVQDCNSSENTRNPKEVALNVHELPTKNQCPVSADDDDDDCISLFADPTIIDEYDDITHSPSHEKPYHMTDKLFDKYYKCNKSEFDEMYENNNVSNSEEINFLPKPNSRPINTKTRFLIRDNDLLRRVFTGHCYRMVQHGECNSRMCTFKHDYMLPMELIFPGNEKRFFLVLEELVSNNCISYTEKFFTNLTINRTADIVCIMKTLKKLYELASITNQMITDIARWLQIYKNSLKTISDQLATIVSDCDFKFINWILSTLRSYTEFGAYWDTCRSLLLKTKCLEPQIIQIILQECTVTRKHLQDIHLNVMRQLDARVYCKLNKQLLLLFDNLVKCVENNAEVKENVAPKSIQTIASPLGKNSEIFLPKNISSETNKDDNNNNNKDAQNDQHPTDESLNISVNKSSETLNRIHISSATNEIDNNNEDKENADTSLTLHTIDGLKEPYSTIGRHRFWPFYQYVDGLQKGLENCDYDRVMEILNSVSINEKSLFIDVCYKILCKEIIRSHRHLNNLIAHTARSGATKVVYQILLEIAIRIMADLAQENYWTLAYTLLKDVYVVLKNQINLHQFDAATVMLFAEIYLANQQPIKALTLLKQSNVILTCRSKWKVRSAEQDDCSRAQVITFLLDELCTSFPEHAFFLFRILITDQFSNYRPIDLARFANRMVSALLQHESHETIVDAGRLIDDYCLTLNTITFRALIASLVSVDMSLAKQLYQKAINLGMYSKPQFYPVISLIINSDWTLEEMFLGIFNLMKQLLLNIGHAIEYVSPKQLSVYLIFESIPLEEQLNYDRGRNRYNRQVEASKTLMKDVLEHKFDPSLSFTKSTRGKVCKLNNKRVLEYLRTEHYE